MYAIKHNKHVATATAPLPDDVIFIAGIEISIILNFTYPVLMSNPNNLIVKTKKDTKDKRKLNHSLCLSTCSTSTHLNTVMIR